MKKQVGSLQGSATSGTKALSPEHRSNLDVTGHKRYEGLDAVRRCCRSLLWFLLWETTGPSLPSGDIPTCTACTWDAHFCIFPPPFPENQRSPTWAHPGQTRFQSVAVCSMYIDEFLTLYIRTVQVWYSYSHSGFYFFFWFSLINITAIFLESLENLKVRLYRWAFVLCFALRAGSATVNDQNCETWLKPTTGLCFLLHVLDPNGWRDVFCCKGTKSHTDYLDFYEWKP